MKIAAITITYNDDFKFKEWISHYNLYKDDLYLHIIVDNGSTAEYIRLLEESFPQSYIIKRKSNGGCTESYNDGIKYALDKKEVDAIMLIGNDVKLEDGGLTKLHAFLNSNIEYGMVAPIFLKKDSTVVEDFGCEVSEYNYMIPYDLGKDISEIKIANRNVASVTGGMNLAKRIFYEKVGLQDEKLFMYSDEVDMAIRTEKLGLKMAVTSDVKSWHQHINFSGNIRSYSVYFLINRNKVYLARKHFGKLKAIKIFFYQVVKAFFGFKRGVNKNEILIFYNIIKGNLFGYFSIMKNPKDRV
jgi:hypothetical protein